MAILIILGIGLFVLAGVLFWKRREFQQRMDLLRQAVPSDAAAVANAYPGEVLAISGTAHPERELQSEYSKVPCIYFNNKVERRYERRRGMISAGRRRRHRSRQRGRETVSQNSQHVPFHLEDATGAARVMPHGAEFDARTVLNRYEPERGQGNPFGIPGLDIDISIGGSERTLGHHYTEDIIPAGEPVFVVGTVDDSGAIASHRSNGSVPMIVSHRNEAVLRDEWGSRERRYLLGAAAAAGIGLLLWFIAAVQWLVSLI
jgi:hypothetical protein